MDPKRAARMLGLIGAALLITVLAMRGMSLASTTMLMRLNPPESNHPRFYPILGHYILSADGATIFFEQQDDLTGMTGWFSMPLEGGTIRPAEDPQRDMLPFMIRDGQLFIHVGDGFSLATGSPRESQVASYALSPDGRAMAFAAYGEGQQWALYILDTEQHLSWLGDEDSLRDLTWSPDGEYLLYVAPRDGIDQIIKIESSGQNLQQLTDDVVRKSSPRWSPDGSQIAYLGTTQVEAYSAGKATATPVWPASRRADLGVTDVFVIQADGSNSRQITTDGQAKTDLAWGTRQDGLEIVYSMRADADLNHAILYGGNVQMGDTRQVYPPYQIDAITCPTRNESRSESSVTVTLTNQGRRPAEVPLLVRSGAARFSMIGRRNTGTVQALTVTIPASGSETTELRVKAAPGLFTHVSALINLGDPYPMDEKNCYIANTYYGLPNLPLLGLIIPVTAAGMAMCIPWLRHRHSRWLWMLWGAVPVAVLVLTGIETWRAWG